MSRVRRWPFRNLDKITVKRFTNVYIIYYEWQKKYSCLLEMSTHFFSQWGQIQVNSSVYSACIVNTIYQLAEIPNSWIDRSLLDINQTSI